MKAAKYLWLLLLLALIPIAVIGSRWLQDNRLPNFTRTAEFYIYPDTNAERALEMIADEAGVKNLQSLKRSFKEKKVAQHISPGHYSIGPKNTSVYVARMLNNAWQSPVHLTLSGNLRIKSNIAAKISSQLLIDSVTVHNALNDSELLSSYGFTPSNVFSLLSPATYELYWTASIEDILDKQKAAYDAYWTAERLALASKLNLNRDEVAILASIVCAESNNEAEMPRIAGVYLNRLKIGMPLQADPTVAFCFDYKPSRILYSHLRVDSPYNTYINYGLPPGPICVPTKAGLEAVLHPDFGGTWGQGNLYFCANPDFSGNHIFARSLSEHNRNARAFQEELSRRSRLKK